MEIPAEPVTEILLEWENGDEKALDRLFPVVYHELRKIAAKYMRKERPEHTLQTTALVNEAYLRLVDQKRVHWKSRAHFFAIAAQMMRRVLIDYARKRRRTGSGSPSRMIPLEDSLIISDQRCEDAILLHEALNKLKSVDERKSLVAELRLFGGLTAEETAEVLRVSAITVTRDWLLAKAWLAREISGTQNNGTS